MIRPCFAAMSVTLLWNMAVAESPVTLPEQAHEIPQAIFRFMEKPEPDYHWTIQKSSQHELGVVHAVTLVSQKWHGITWKHDLVICEPKVNRHPTKALLYIGGGSSGRAPSQDQVELGLALANAAGAPVAALYQVPNQPLLDGRYEDDAISETWLRYLETGDETWPLLFPMVKSAIKAMDAVQEMASKYRNATIDGFMITGASKRGWTSWLAPVVDQRIIGTAPMVIDMLNVREQMRHQKMMWGKFSDSIKDYTEKQLVNLGEESQRERDLRLMMDPYTYRSRLTLPKLIINGANDPYWCADSLNLYWDGLLGRQNHILQIANAGHGLQGKNDLALSSIAAFFDCVASGRPYPQLAWNWSEASRTLTVQASPRPQSMRLWTALSEDQDFRPDRFESREIEPSGESCVFNIEPVTGKHQLFFAEALYQTSERPYAQTTPIWRID